MRFISAALAFSVSTLFAQALPPAPAAPSPASPADPNKVVLAVGDRKMTAAEYDSLINALPPQTQAAIQSQGKRAFAERIAELLLLAQEAQKRKIDQEPKVKNEIAFQRENLLANAMYLELQNNAKVDDAAIAKYYNEHQRDFEVVKARHILIRVKGAPMQAPPGKPELTDEEALAKAKAIRMRLEGGEDFAAVARAESDDTGSAAQGGDLGEFRKGMMVPPFEQAAYAAKVGEITEPVKSPFGYHIIKVESHTTKSLAEARPDIEKKLRPELARDEVAALRKNAAIQLDDSFFGPPPQAALTPRGALPGGGPPPAPAPPK